MLFLQRIEDHFLTSGGPFIVWNSSILAVSFMYKPSPVSSVNVNGSELL
jgi:hypothetical protein